jgi:hypothetical protein
MRLFLFVKSGVSIMRHKNIQGGKTVKIEINRIKVKERIRKEVAKIDDLALDIIENGLLNPITVMELPNGNYQLLAGLRRLKAIELLEYSEIDVSVVLPTNAEAVLKIEISENEQREPFTFSERMDFARMLEEIEQLKSKERMSLGGKGGIEQGTPRGAYLQKGETREIVAEKIGMGKTTYDRAKYISENAPGEVIAELDRGERSIRGTYEELRATENNKSFVIAESEEDSNINDVAAEAEELADKLLATTFQMRPKQERSEFNIEDYLDEQNKEVVRHVKEFYALPPEEKIEELLRQLKAERKRAAYAESELARLKEVMSKIQQCNKCKTINHATAV